jgi:hypothetical protein
MGNWRTVNIAGTMSAADAARLYDLLDWGDYAGRDRDVPREAECLSFSSAHPGLAGLGAWPDTTMDRRGNLHERDYTVEDVHRALGGSGGACPVDAAEGSLRRRMGV